MDETEPPAVEIEYVVTEDLKDLDNPKESLQTLVVRLDSKDWLTVCDALNNTRQLARYHRDDLKGILMEVVPLVLKSMKNPRSALCKTALMAIGDLFKFLGMQMIRHVNSLLLQLILKATQDKKFVCEEAENALISMTNCLPPAPILRLLEPYSTHKNPRVRAKATVCLYYSFTKLEPKEVQEYGLESLLRIAGTQASDQLPEAREAARKLALELKKAFNIKFEEEVRKGESQAEMKETSWEQLCHKQMSSTSAQVILKVTGVGSR